MGSLSSVEERALQGDQVNRSVVLELDRQKRLWQVNFLGERIISGRLIIKQPFQLYVAKPDVYRARWIFEHRWER